MSGRLEVFVLGNVEAQREAAPVALGGTKLQALVALLALGAPHPMSGDRLIDELWGDRPPANPANALQAQISHVRRLLGSDAVVRQGSAYRIRVEPDDVDANRLERLIKRARAERGAGEVAAAITTFQSALALVRGHPLAGLGDFEFAGRASARLDEMVVATHEDLVDCLLTVGHHAETVTILSELVRAHPARERLHGQLMLALYRCGRQSDALRAFQTARSTLIDEFGVEPGAALLALERAVLDRDPALEASDVPLVTGASSREEQFLSAAEDQAAHSLSVHGGRGAELTELRSDLQSAMSGHGRAAIISGEPGIGKTWLAEQLAQAAAAAGAVVVWGRGYTGRGAPAFWPWVQVVDGLLDRFSDEALRSALRFGAGDLAQIVPQIKELIPGLDPPAPADPETAQFRVFEAITGFLRRLSQTQPIVVIFDDLHWSDAASQQLVLLTSAAAADAKLMLVALYRDVDPYLDDGLAATLVDLTRQREVRRIELGGLDDHAVTAMLQSAGGLPTPDAVVTVMRRTRGNPFFLNEILRLLPDSAGGLDAATVQRVVPGSVRGALRRRLARLAPDTVQVLNAASVLGNVFELALMADIMGVQRGDLLHPLHLAVESGLIVRHESDIGRFAFSHGLVQEALYEDLGAGERAEWHRRSAEAMEREYAGVEGAHLLALAEHWYRATPAVAPDQGIAAALRAATWAAGHLAHEQAEQRLRAGIQLTALMPRKPERAALELDLQDQLAGLLLTTKGYASAGLVDACDRMRVLCDELDEIGRRAQTLWRLAIIHLYRCDFEQSSSVGHELVRMAGEPGGSGAASLGHFALGLSANHSGRVGEARAHFDAALAAVGPVDDGDVARFASETTAVIDQVFSAWNLVLLDRADEAEAAIAVALEAAIAGGQTYPLAYALTFAADVAMLRRDANAARRHADRGFAVATENNHQFLVPFMVGVRGWARAAVEGDVESAVVDVEDAAAGVAASGVQFWAHAFRGMLADVYLMGGAPADALRAADEGLALCEA
ncbi:MAG: transcriptional regulator, putative ATPase, winged helix family, partial [Desertimonas sp.]|nr:transcriptional regulator, putative ATPase, winged helix family [Desertimonas sp.]